MAIARKFVDCGCNAIIAGTNEEKLSDAVAVFMKKIK